MGTRRRPVATGHEASAIAAQRWAEVRAAAEAALALAPEVRADFLERACGADSALRAEVEAQVNACERAAESPEFLAQPAAGFVAPLFARLPNTPGDDIAGDTESLRHTTAEPTEVEAALRAALAGHYEVERELGRGGSATVYVAYDRRHARRVAFKVFDPVLGAALSAERFLREIRVTAGLTHPHILPLHDSGEVPAGHPDPERHEGKGSSFLYYVMPYVEGETLRERLTRERCLTPDAVLRLVREVASALDYAHRRGLVHRDIKPANILLADGHAVVADFGIARAVHRAREATGPDETREAVRSAEGGGSDTLTAAGASPGTPAYMAPEQTRVGTAVDHRADLYALGVVAYEALAGAHPFGARSREGFVAAHRDEEPAPLDARRSDAPPALAALITQLLAKDPAARPQTAADVLRVLETVTPRPAAPRSDRRRAMFAVAATLIVVAGIGAYAASRRPDVSPEQREPAAQRDVVGAVSRPGSIRAVAVLPFENTGGVEADDYFSDGLTDELAHALGRLPGLQVAGRTSSYAFKGKAAGAQEIGRVLGVGAIVGGTVRRAGGQLRVTAQLVSAADGTVLWDSVYESRSGDVFAVQDEVTRAVVAALTPALGDRGGSGGARAAPAERGTTDAEAYELYLKGRYYWLERGRANVARSIAYFRQAVARDAAFARGHAGLALAYTVLPIYVADPTDSATALVAASAARALALDSTLADAHVALGGARARELRLRDAEAAYRAALAAEPSNVSARQGLGLVLLTLGRTEEALGELRHAAQLDPLAKSAGTAHALALISARRFSEALAVERRVLALDSTFSLALWGAGLAQTLGGQSDSAVRTLERGMRLHPETPGQHSALLLAYAAAGRWADAERVRAKLRRPGGDPSGGAMAAFAELVFGDPEPLVRLLSTAAGQRRWIDAEGALGCNPLLDPLWADARFREAMRRLSVEVCPLVRPWPVPPRSMPRSVQTSRVLSMSRRSQTP